MARGDEHFPRRERLRTHWEFEQVRRHGHGTPGRFLVLAILRRKEEYTRRVGFIVSKRVGNAVARNRIKRRLRGIYRTHRIQLNTGIWLVLIARQTASQASYHELESDFLQLIQLVMRKISCQP